MSKIIEVDFKTKRKIKDDIIEESPAKNLPLYHRTDYKPVRNCVNLDSYGVICVRCRRCGRKDLKN